MASIQATEAAVFLVAKRGRLMLTVFFRVARRCSLRGSGFSSGGTPVGSGAMRGAPVCAGLAAGYEPMRRLWVKMSAVPKPA